MFIHPRNAVAHSTHTGVRVLIALVVSRWQQTVPVCYQLENTGPPRKSSPKRILPFEHPILCWLPKPVEWNDLQKYLIYFYIIYDSHFKRLNINEQQTCSRAETEVIETGISFFDGINFAVPRCYRRFASDVLSPAREYAFSNIRLTIRACGSCQPVARAAELPPCCSTAQM